MVSPVREVTEKYGFRLPILHIIHAYTCIDYNIMWYANMQEYFGHYTVYVRITSLVPSPLPAAIFN